MIDTDLLAAERPCRHDWREIGEDEYWPDEGGIETGECIYIYGWECLKCGDKQQTQSGEPPIREPIGG